MTDLSRDMNRNNSRTTRAQEARESDQIHDEYQSWDEESILDTSYFPAREGFVQRWVRTTVKGQADHRNVQRRYMRGWRPRLKSTAPKGHFVTRTMFEGEEVIGTPDMILMERPAKLHEKQRAEVEQATQMQMEAVDNDLLKVHDPHSGMTRPTINRKSRVTKGRLAEFDD